ncbi:MAG: glycosyltransferase family 4 protein, partial [Anaerolineaceae bacterium]|nr:glycosyltransferase family 4 protein [Anaerolineaceae bacterium]
PQRSELEMITLEMNLSNVKFLGQLDFHELIKIVSQAKFSVLPSEVYENCPMAVLESMAMGKPVIGAKIGGIPELINDNVDGFLFESGNSEDLAEKINKMIDDPDMNQEMGINARKKIEQLYNPEIHYQQVMILYDQLLEKQSQ